MSKWHQSSGWNWVHDQISSSSSHTHSAVFGDGQKPPVITAVEKAKLYHSALFKFNNTANNIIEGGDDNFNKMFWRILMGINSFKKFFATFQNTQSFSLVMTKDVLDRRSKTNFKLSLNVSIGRWAEMEKTSARKTS